MQKEIAVFGLVLIMKDQIKVITTNTETTSSRIIEILIFSKNTLIVIAEKRPYALLNDSSK